MGKNVSSKKPGQNGEADGRPWPGTLQPLGVSIFSVSPGSMTMARIFISEPQTEAHERISAIDFFNQPGQGGFLHFLLDRIFRCFSGYLFCFRRILMLRFFEVPIYCQLAGRPFWICWRIREVWVRKTGVQVCNSDVDYIKSFQPKVLCGFKHDFVVTVDRFKAVAGCTCEMKRVSWSQERRVWNCFNCVARQSNNLFCNRKPGPDEWVLVGFDAIENNVILLGIKSAFSVVPVYIAPEFEPTVERTAQTGFAL